MTQIPVPSLTVKRLPGAHDSWRYFLNGKVKRRKGFHLYKFALLAREPGKDWHIERYSRTMIKVTAFERDRFRRKKWCDYQVVDIKEIEEKK